MSPVDRPSPSVLAPKGGVREGTFRYGDYTERQPLELRAVKSKGCRRGSLLYNNCKVMGIGGVGRLPSGSSCVVCGTNLRALLFTRAQFAMAPSRPPTGCRGSVSTQGRQTRPKTCRLPQAHCRVASHGVPLHYIYATSY